MATCMRVSTWVSAGEGQRIRRLHMNGCAPGVVGAEQLFKLKLKAGNKASITKGDITKRENRIAKLEELLLKKETEIADAKAEAEREKIAIQVVSQEMLGVFADPVLRRKYFAMVDMDELIENEFNLNLPRYIDTVEPEREIPIAEAKEELTSALEAEKEAEKELNNLLEILN